MGSLDERKLSETGAATDFSKEDAILYVNGKRYVLPPDAAHRTLLEYLRGLVSFHPFCLPIQKQSFPCSLPSVNALVSNLSSCFHWVLQCCGALEQHGWLGRN